MDPCRQLSNHLALVALSFISLALSSLGLGQPKTTLGSQSAINGTPHGATFYGEDESLCAGSWAARWRERPCVALLEFEVALCPS